MRAEVLIFEKSWRVGGWLVRRPEPTAPCWSGFANGLASTGLADIRNSFMDVRFSIGDLTGLAAPGGP
jgi:hypothetical protein